MTDYPETCASGHPLAEANDAHRALLAHVAGLDGPRIVAEIRCLTANVMPVCEVRLGPADYLAMTVLVAMVQRLDGAPSPSDDVIPPVEGAIVAGKCSCHDEVSLYDKLTNYADARNRHVDLHIAERGDTPAGGYL